MAVYIEFEGIKGNVTAQGFADHIAVHSIQFGVGRGITMEAGNMANREATKPSLSEITFTKSVDISSPLLFQQSVGGQAGKAVKIKFVKTGANKVEHYMDYELKDCLVSGYSISAGGESEAVESITLSYSEIKVSYQDRDMKNSNKNPLRAFYNLAEGKAG